MQVEGRSGSRRRLLKMTEYVWVGSLCVYICVTALDNH